jgi:hypothetical protein
MALPKAIQQQVDAADDLVAQMNGQPTNVDPDPNSDPGTDVNTELSPQPVSPEPQPQPTVSEETYQAKFFTLKGKYDAEVPRLHAQVRELTTQVQQLIAENAAKPAPVPEPVKTLITEQDKEAFGSDLLDLIDRATEQKIAGFREREGQLLAEINELKGTVGKVDETMGANSKEMFLDRLAKQVPNWEALNVDQGFLAWLAEVDPVYGLPRQAALNNAYESLDAARTASIFKQYQATQPQAPAPQQSNRQQLQRQVAPTRSRTSPAPAASASDSRIFTQGEIAQFYEEWRRGFFDSDEAARMEKEIHAAIAAGRVR